MNDAGSKLRILIVDDDEVTRKLLREVLEKEGYAVELAASGEEAVQKIHAKKFPIVLSDIRMVEMDGVFVLRESKRLNTKSAVILMTGFGSMEGAVEAIREGAFDYVSKPFRMEALKAVVARAAKHWESSRDMREIGTLGRMEAMAKGVIGKSPRIVEVYKTLARAALSSTNVLVIGESGTEKELVARAIHEHSGRREKRFVPASCRVISETILESELFKEANGGTLFLDEVGDVPLALQVKLLRAIQEGEFRAAGSLESKKVDVRVIAATRRDLEGLVRAGRFRDDLYYRLKVISIDLPPLRERMEDLPELISHYLTKYARKNRKTISHVSEEGMELLRSYSWPGNVRELENVIERAVAMSNTAILFPEDFPLEISSFQAGRRIGQAHSLEEMERFHIVKVLNEVNFNKSRASEVLGIDRATLYRKAQRYGIDLHGR